MKAVTIAKLMVAPFVSYFDLYILSKFRLDFDKISLLPSDFEDIKDYDVIIGCDTVVLFNNNIIGKPINVEDARATLHRYSIKMFEKNFSVIELVPIVFKVAEECLSKRLMAVITMLLDYQLIDW